MITTYQNDGATPYLHLNNPFPNGLIQPPGNSLGLLNDVGFKANGPLRTSAANRTPNEQSWSLGIERELPSNIVINAEYIGKKGTHLPFSGFNQLNLLGSWIESLPITGCRSEQPVPDPHRDLSQQLCGQSVRRNHHRSQQQLCRAHKFSTLSCCFPFPQFTGVSTEPQLIANSIYHGLQLLAEKRYSNGLQFLVTYTWSKSIDDSSQADDNVTWLGSFSSLQDPNKPRLERSLSTFDIPHVFQFSYSYDLPIRTRSRRSWAICRGRWMLIIGGWKTNGIWRISDGRPLTFTVADGNLASDLWRYSDPTSWGHPSAIMARIGWTTTLWITAFSSVLTISRWATLRAPLGSVRSPWSFTTDLSLGKQFPIREEMNFEFRIEAQNAFNHPVFGTPNTTVDDENFGAITYTSVGPREVQLAVKFNF